MNIFSKVTLKSMKKSRTRTIVTIIGVILSTIMVTAVTTFAISLQKYMVNGAIQKYGNWHMAFLDVDASFMQEQTANDEVINSARFENIGYARLDGGKNPNKPYLFIAGFHKETFETLPINLISGRLPQNSREIVVPAHVAANGDVQFSVGDTLSLEIGSRISGNENLGQHNPYREPYRAEVFVPQTKKTYTVVGICERPGFEEYTAPGYTLITLTDLEQLEDAVDQFSLFVTLKNPHKLHTYASQNAQDQNYIFNEDVLRFMGLSGDHLFNTLLYAIGGILIILIMMGSIFLIYNAFSIVLNERMHQFGILSSVGATPKQLRNSVLFEGLCIGIVGIPIGIVIGIGSIRVVLYMVATNFRNILYEEVPLTLSINVPTLVMAAVVSMMTILISAYMPARKAANTPVMESIRQTNEIKIQSKDIKTSKWVERVCGLEGTLALKNFKRNKRRYHSIVLSLSLSVVLFVCGSTFGTHLKQAAKQSVMDGDYDLLFVTEDMEEDEVFRLYDKLRTIDGIDESSYQAILPYSCTVKVSELSEDYRETMSYHSLNETIHLPMDIQFIEDCIYLDFIESLDLPIDEYTGENAKMITVGKFKKVEDTKDSQKVMTNLFAERFMNCTVAPEINHQPQVEQGKKISMLLVDTVPLDALPVHPSEVKPYMFMVVAPYSLKAQFEASGIKQQIGLTFLSENPSPVMAKMESMIQSEGITSDYTLYNVSEIMEQNRNLLFIVNVFTYVFVMMISLIATANVFNTISTNIRLRRRELAMIRSIGMSDHDLQKMMHFECAFYGIKTLIFALPIASICSWLIYQGLIEGGAEMDFIFPWGSIGISSFGVFFIVFITMLYAVRKIQKENIIDGLRDELS